MVCVKDVWIVTFDTLNHYLAYLVDGNGISNAPVISQSALDESVPLLNDGDLKLSQDGSKLVLMDPIKMAEFDLRPEKITEVPAHTLFAEAAIEILNQDQYKLFHNCITC